MKQSMTRLFAILIGATLCTPLLAQTPPPVVVNWSSGVSYTYDGSGNVQQIGKDTFAYDHVGRLIQANVNGARRNYEYDAFGNRKTCRQNDGMPSASDCQAFTVRSTDNHIAEASYDPSGSGNVTALAGHAYSWDAFNMMKRDQFGDAREFVYTADDERIAVYAAGDRSWRWTVRDVTNKPLREITSQGGSLGTASFQWVKDYIWRDSALLASRQPEGPATTTYHYHLDHLGTPRRITDAADNTVGFHDYHAFGPEERGQQEPSSTRVKYTGHERDASGDTFGTLDYMHARYYNPVLGRFFSIDPVINPGAMKNPQMWNRYAYAASNPMTRIDPDGQNWFEINKVWEWHPGDTFKATDGKVYTSNYTHLLVVQQLGPNAQGGTVYQLTLYDQDKAILTGKAWSGGAGGARPIDPGAYKIITSLRDATGPTQINPKSGHPPVYYGIQKINQAWLPIPGTGLVSGVGDAWGAMRARLNPMDKSMRDRGLYFHGQLPKAPHYGETNGCLTYGSDPTIINYLWKLTPRQDVPVSVDQVVKP